MAGNTNEMRELLDQIKKLPSDWHAAGTPSGRVLEAIFHHAGTVDLHHTVETGSGKTTLLLSHLSSDHTVFSMDDGNGSLDRVKESPLLHCNTVRYVEGPTQETVPRYPFDNPLQLVLLDGPHAFPFPQLEYYHVYPVIQPGGVLIVDDIDIPSIHDMFRVLRADAMFDLEATVETTAFFRRTSAPTFDPRADGWWMQGYNRRKRFVDRSLFGLASYLLPRSLKQRMGAWLGRRKTR